MRTSTWVLEQIVQLVSSQTAVEIHNGQNRTSLSTIGSFKHWFLLKRPTISRHV